MKRFALLVVLALATAAAADPDPKLADHAQGIVDFDTGAKYLSFATDGATLATWHSPAGDYLHQVPTEAPPAAPADVKVQLLAFAVKFVLFPLVIALVGLALAGLERLRKKWTAEADAATAKGESDNVATVLAKFMGFAEVVVQDLENNEKTAFEAATADGVISADEGKQLKEIALGRLKALAGTEGLKELQEVLGIAAEGLPAFLSGLVEKAVALVSTRSANIAALNAKAPAPAPAPPSP